jgi:predicted RNA-binding protein with PUA-like domain
MAKTAQRHWLVKTEPDTFSIDDWAKEPNQTTCWDGVRNYQARNFLRDQMQVGDGVLIYHSSTVPPAVVGTGVVVRAGYPDHTAWDKKNPHYDPASTKDKPRWFMVDIRLERKFKRPLSLESLREIPALKDMELLRKGSRLSVQPVGENHWKKILAMT